VAWPLWGWGEGEAREPGGVTTRRWATYVDADDKPRNETFQRFERWGNSWKAMEDTRPSTRQVRMAQLMPRLNVHRLGALRPHFALLNSKGLLGASAGVIGANAPDFP
jgi:hypothetical protein